MENHFELWFTTLDEVNRFGSFEVNLFTVGFTRLDYVCLFGSVDKANHLGCLKKKCYRNALCRVVKLTELVLGFGQGPRPPGPLREQ